MAEYYNYNYNGAPGKPGGAPNNRNNNNNSELWSWIIVVGALVIFWPVGLILLFRKLMGGSSGSKSSGQAGRHPYDVQQGQRPGQSQQPGQGQQAPGAAQGQYQYSQRPGPAQAAGPKGKNPGMNRNPGTGRFVKKVPAQGKGLTIGGAITAGIGAMGFLAILSEVFYTGWYGLGELFPCLGVVGVGLALLYAGIYRGRKGKRFRKYLALIGKRTAISISTLAQAMPVSYKTACNDLQDMIDDGYLPAGYVDTQRGRLVLSDEGIMDDEEEEEPPVQEAPKEQDENTILMEIKAVNDAIPDPEMSRKIDRIGEITGKILDYQRKNPNKAGQLRSFLNYYLPTTLKILRAYAQLDAQGVEGENISAAKERIEGMMDKVVEGFEKQLDKLFQNDAMDITADVQVLEKMLDNDGLSHPGDGMTMTL